MLLNSETTKNLLSQNEFGRALVDVLTNPSTPFDVGGHCVVPREAFECVIEMNWAIPHPFAGIILLPHALLSLFI